MTEIPGWLSTEIRKQDIYESLIELLFPSDITEHFKIVHIESLPQVMVVHFEEKFGGLPDFFWGIKSSFAMFLHRVY